MLNICENNGGNRLSTVLGEALIERLRTRLLPNADQNLMNKLILRHDNMHQFKRCFLGQVEQMRRSGGEELRVSARVSFIGSISFPSVTHI